jgi:hypothetical protein
VTRSSRAIHIGLGLVTHAAAYLLSAVVFGAGYALGTIGHARSMGRAYGQRIRDVIEPEPMTVEDLVRRVDDERDVAIIVIEDSTERAASNDQRWN